MVMKLCARCQKLIEAPKTYCERCKPIVEQQIEENKQRNNSRYNKSRDSKYTKFYNSKQWRNLSKDYRDKHYLCEECEKEAKLNGKYNIQLSEEVHHKEAIKIETGWQRRFDWNNLIALCHYHHDLVEKRFKRRKK